MTDPLKGAEETSRLEKAYATGYADGIAAAAKACDGEAGAYSDSAKQCDAGGNTFGGTMDTAGALSARRCAEAIRALLAPPSTAGDATEDTIRYGRVKVVMRGSISPDRLDAEHETAGDAKAGETCATCGGTAIDPNLSCAPCPNCRGTGRRSP